MESRIDSSTCIRETLDRFLKEKSPGALLVSGAWGVGKTFLCRSVLEEARTTQKLAYSYVSLYGISNSEDVLMRIVTGCRWAGAPPPSWVKDASKHFTKLGDIFAGVVGAGGAFSATGRAAGTAMLGLLAKRAVIVFDDLERRDASLSIKTVLGIISHLVEDRECRVILICNDDALEGDREQFQAQKEKCFNFEVKHVPNAAENVAVVLNDSELEIREIANRLNIVNLRVLKKVSHAVKCLESCIPEKTDPDLQALFRKNAATLSTLYYA